METSAYSWEQPAILFCSRVCRSRSPSDVYCLFNGLNGKNSSRSNVRNISSVFVFLF